MAAPADRLLADKDGIDAIARGLVREYLLRKGMRSVLDSFDAEAPPAASVASTSDLVKSLRLGALYKRSRAQDKPVDSVLELLTHFFYAKDFSSAAASPGALLAAPPQPPVQAAATFVPSKRPTIPKLPLGRVQAPFSSVEPPAAPRLPGPGPQRRSVSSTHSEVSPLQPTVPTVSAPGPPPAAAVDAGGGFWARLNAAKQAEAQAAAAASSEAEAPAASAIAAALLEGEGSFWARLHAKKAADAAVAGPAPAFTAPDGKEFSDRSEYRRYMFNTFYTFADKTGEILVKHHGDIQGQAFNIQRLVDCEVRLLDHCDAMHVEHLTRCKVFIAASSESVFVRNCTDCDLYMACKQLRTRDCTNCRFFLYTKTDPIIETSTNMQFAPFLASAPLLDKLFVSANLDAKHNHWRRVFDFNKGELTTPEPHWVIMDPEQHANWTIEVTGQPAPINPVPIDAGAEDASDGASLEGVMAFDIRSISQDAAQARLHS